MPEPSEIRLITMLKGCFELKENFLESSHETNEFTMVIFFGYQGLCILVENYPRKKGERYEVV